MRKLSLRARLGNAWAAIFGEHGEVTQQARRIGCSRQTVYNHGDEAQQAFSDADQLGPCRAELFQENQRLQQENQQLWQWLEEALEPSAGQQRQFAATAAALGLSLGQTRMLLAIVLPRRACPSRAKLGRWVQKAAGRASRVLRLLDQVCQPLVLILCLDEIFFRRQPVLMGVEPHSMAWVVGQRSADRSGDTWQKALAPWPYLEAVVADAGSGLQAGLTQLQQQRQGQPGQRPLDVSLDLFHTQQEAQRVLRVLWTPVERAWHQAEKADQVLVAKRWHGDKLPAQRAAHAATRAWRKASKLFRAYEGWEAAWQRIAAAFAMFRPDGQLNDRAAAQAEIDQALRALTGPLWSKVRNFVLDPRSLAFLDRLHQRLAAAEPRADVRTALVELWRLRHPQRGQRSSEAAAQARVQALVQGVVCQGLAADWRTAYRQVAQILSRTVRASSVVECMNSVVRMHQARHRNLSQPLLDLKRLYWNCRPFREGKRRDRCPYQLLGLPLPTYDPWLLLQADPDTLKQELSSPNLAA
jgi:hypothetical protein